MHKTISYNFFIICLILYPIVCTIVSVDCFGEIIVIKARYREISEQIAQMIESDKSLTKLPGVFRLSKIFEADTKTISKALHLLAESGKVTIKGTHGTFVAKSNGVCYKRIAIVGYWETAYLKLMKDITEMANKKGYELVVISKPSPNDKLDSKFLCNLLVDGFIFSNSTLNQDIIFKLREKGIPFVSLNRISEIPGVDWIDFDNEKAMMTGFDYLETLGHKRIAYLGFHYELEEHHQRIKKLFKSLSKKLNGGIYDKSLWGGEGNYKEYFNKFGYRAFEEYCRSILVPLFALKEPPTAIYVAGKAFCEILASLLKELKLSAPEDVSILVRSIVYGSEGDEKFWSLIESSGDKCFQSALQALFRKIENPNCEPFQKLLAPKVKECKSTSTLEAEIVELEV
jgi:DNA-binding LacI/PurR family transcriptional regulator